MIAVVVVGIPIVGVMVAVSEGSAVLKSVGSGIIAVDSTVSSGGIAVGL